MDFAAKVGIVLFAIFVAFLLAGITGIVVMLLWNWLMPSIFGLREINFWEAWGLTWLCSLLFKTTVETKKN